jgi:hypothetical protein
MELLRCIARVDALKQDRIKQRQQQSEEAAFLK